MTPSTPGPGLGIIAGLDRRLAGELAQRCARLGYGSLWSNDEPSAFGLDTLAAFAEAAPQLELGVGVLPIDRHPPATIAAAVDRLGLDPATLWLGIGAGSVQPQLDAVRRAVAELREVLPPEIRIVVAAMRPRLCRLAGAVADGVLLNWMLPEQAERAREWVHEGADEAGVPPPVTAMYVRVAVGPGATRRLRDDEARYREINEGHRRHFAAMDVPLGTVGIAAPDRPGVVGGLAPYRRAIDLPIVRVLADEGAAALFAVADAAAPLTPDAGGVPE
jgi:alkanesulfonate monooxygenase SsuD/methylene tetrahydromethanopterin reductase-like flavin-dependent oxidoreductase (luciferase family)